MTETDPRSDVYTLVAFLAELDRVLHPLLRGARGRVRLGPTFPPPLLSFDGPTSPPAGFSGPRTPGPGSRRSSSQASTWGPSPQASAPHLPRFEVPAPPPVRTEPAPQAGSASGAALPSHRAEAETILPPGAELPRTPSQDPLDLRSQPVPLPGGDRLAAPTHSLASRRTGGAAPPLLDGRTALAQPAQAPPLASPPSPPSASEPRSTAGPLRLPAPQRTASPGPLRLPMPTVAAPARSRTDRPVVASFAGLPLQAPQLVPSLPAGALPFGSESTAAHAPEQRLPPPHAVPSHPAPGARPTPSAAPAEDLAQASVEFQTIEADDAPLVSEPAPEQLPLAPLDWLSLRRGGRLRLSPAELQRVTHKLTSAFLDRALMRHR